MKRFFKSLRRSLICWWNTPPVTKRFFIDNKEVTEAEWYANGGLEAEEELNAACEELQRAMEATEVK
jgi:hypothetical protein